MGRVSSSGALLLCCAAAFAAAGCGKDGQASSAGVRLQREDLILVSRALQATRTAAAREVAATKQAWPLVARGLPSNPPSGTRASIRRAARAAAAVNVPALFGEAEAAALTGPAASIAGLFGSYTGLARRGWQMSDAAITEMSSGSPAAARFAHANAALYVDSIYDGHFELAQIGRQLTQGYRKLGGAAAFGQALSQAEVNALADAYSERTARLHPHVSARLGS